MMKPIPPLTAMPMASSTMLPPRKPGDRKYRSGTSGEVERPGPAAVVALAQHLRAHRDHQDRHRHVDEEDPAPAGSLRERTAQQRADRAADTAGRTPRAECPVALPAL